MTPHCKRILEKLNMPTAWQELRTLPIYLVSRAGRDDQLEALNEYAQFGHRAVPIIKTLLECNERLSVALGKCKIIKVQGVTFESEVATQALTENESILNKLIGGEGE